MICRASILLGSVGVLLLPVGCKVGPDYAEPTETLPPEWSQVPSRFTPGAQADLHRWWAKFNDPTLTRVIEIAETNNQLLAESIANLRAAYARVGVTEAQYWPSVALASLYSRDLVNASQVPAQGVEIQPYNVYAYGAGMAQWEIDLWGKIARQVESATAQAQSSMEDLRAVLISIRGQAGSAYAQVRTLQQRIKAAESIVGNLRSIRDLASQKLTAGVATQLDVNRAQATLDQAQASIPPLKSALTSTINTLAVLCGTTPGPMMAIVGQVADIPTGPEAIGVGIPAELLLRRPDVRAKERRLAATVAMVGANEALHYPAFSLSGNFYISATDLSGLGDFSNKAYSFGPTLQWLIFDGGRINSLVAESKAKADAALASYRNTVLTAVQDVESAIAAVAQSQEALGLLKDAETNASQAAQLAQLQFSQGLIPLSTALDVENSLINIQQQRIQTQGLLAQDIVGLYRALGGGWESSATSITGEGIAETKPSEV